MVGQSTGSSIPRSCASLPRSCLRFLCPRLAPHTASHMYSCVDEIMVLVHGLLCLHCTRRCDKNVVVYQSWPLSNFCVVKPRRRCTSRAVPSDGDTGWVHYHAYQQFTSLDTQADHSTIHYFDLANCVHSDGKMSYRSIVPPPIFMV